MSLRMAFHSGETPFSFFQMTKKWLKEGCFLIAVALLLALPLYRSVASFFDEGLVVDLVNKDRSERDIESLVVNEQLSLAAKEKAQDMISNDYFAHTSPSGVTPWHWIEKSGYDYVFAGENLAINFANPEDQQRAWMNSESHRKNILNKKYKEIGVAVVKGKINGKQAIITVQEFGTKLSVVPVEKRIAGLSVTKATADSMNIKENKYVGINAVEKIPAIVFKKISPVPLIVFMYIAAIMIAFIFFTYEVTHRHIHFSSHWFTMHRKRKVFVPINIKHQEYIFSESAKQDENLEKIYITHMKMRN